MYLTITIPHMMFIMSLISRYISKSIELYLQAIKKALRYLKGTMNYGILYKNGGAEEFFAFTDNYYIGDFEDVEDKRSK